MVFVRDLLILQLTRHKMSEIILTSRKSQLKKILSPGNKSGSESNCRCLFFFFFPLQVEYLYSLVYQVLDMLANKK